MSLESLPPEARDQVRRFCRQYWQREPHLTFPAPHYLCQHAVQDLIFQRLWGPENQKPPGPPRYQLKTLKQLVAQVEAAIDDWEEQGVHDGLMEHMTALLSQPLPSEMAAAQQKTYVVYSLSALGVTDDHRGSDADCPAIVLRESRTIIAAQGTTGLATWEAALHLGQYLCREPGHVRGKHVLELGAGTGYLSVLCARHLDAATVLASDGSDEVVHNLPETFFLNELQGVDQAMAIELKWGHALLGTEEPQWRGGRPVDVVLGADITYDSSALPMLMATLTDLVSLFPQVEILVAATERNETTFAAFQRETAQAGFSIEELDFLLTPQRLQTGPFYSDTVPIHIFALRKKGVASVEKMNPKKE